MKNPPYEACLKLGVVIWSSLVMPTAVAADTNAAPMAQSTPVLTAQAPVPERLPYGVGDVLSLCRARISEDVIVTYIRNSGTAYTLGPREIVYLRDEGVSDRVITVMMDQRKQVAADNTQQALQQATQQAAQQAIQSPNPALPAPGVPLVVDPNALLAPPYPAPYEPCVEEEPPPPASSLYVIPDPAVRAAYYGGVPFGVSYYGSGYPFVYGPGGSSVYHFGRGSGGSGRGTHRGGFHTIPRR